MSKSTEKVRTEAYNSMSERLYLLAYTDESWEAYGRIDEVMQLDAIVKATYTVQTKAEVTR